MARPSPTAQPRGPLIWMVQGKIVSVTALQIVIPVGARVWAFAACKGVAHRRAMCEFAAQLDGLRDLGGQRGG